MANTEITRTYNAAKLDVYGSNGIHQVGLIPEVTRHAGHRAEAGRGGNGGDDDEPPDDGDSGGGAGGEPPLYTVQTMEDDRVCEDCLDLANEIYELDEARTLIPAHPNCRCSVVPLR